MAFFSSGPSIPGIDRSRRTTAKRWLSVVGAAATSASAPAADRRYPPSCPSRSGSSDRTSALRGVVVDDQSAVTPVRPARAATTAVAGCDVGTHTDREPEGASHPERLDTPQSPPMSATSWPLMASPRPVPPYFREVDVSAWTKGWKIVSSLSGAMPSPVSDTSKRTHGLSPRSQISTRLTRTTISPAWVNLTALPMRLVRTWRTRPGSPLTSAGTELLDHGDQLEALGLSRARQQVHDIVDDGPHVELDVLDLELPGLDLGEVEDVVDDGQQAPRPSCAPSGRSRADGRRGRSRAGGRSCR